MKKIIGFYLLLLSLFSCNSKEIYLQFENIAPINRMNLVDLAESIAENPDFILDEDQDKYFKDYQLKRADLSSDLGEASFFMVDGNSNGIFNELGVDFLAIGEYGAKAPVIFFDNPIQTHNIYVLNEYVISVSEINNNKDLYQATLNYQAITEWDSVNKYNRIFDRVPELSFFEVNSAQQHNLQELTGRKKLTLVEFWTSWCSPCLQSMPDLKEIQEKYGSIIEIVTINSDKKNLPKVKELVKKYNMTWINGLTNDDLEDKMDFGFYPNGYLFDENGKVIQFNASPYTTMNYLEQFYLSAKTE